nr:SpoVR family protein [Pseudobdellovibrionaceae bacterium]
DFKAIKAKLLFFMTNFGQPLIQIENGNFENRGELHLVHRHEGIDLQPDFLSATLKNVFKVWSRPVHLSTIMENENITFSFDGKEYQQKK